jgi:hypothetical protein
MVFSNSVEDHGLQLSVECPTRARMGASCTVVASITNKGENFALSKQGFPPEQWVNFSLSAERGDNPARRFYSRFTADGTGIGRGSSIPPEREVVIRKLKPRETVQEKRNLNSMFQIDTPGQYHLTVTATVDLPAQLPSDNHVFLVVQSIPIEIMSNP